MEFEKILNLVDDDPVFESALLLSGNVNPKVVRLQLSRWVKSGRIYQLRRGLYAFAPPYQKIKPHPFLVANHLKRASYISMQSALAFYGLIPETVNITVSVTTSRPERLDTPLGIYEFRHVKTDLFFGYEMIDLNNQKALVAVPEKALLDMIYLHPGGESSQYLEELRLQNMERLNLSVLERQSEIFASPKLRKAVVKIADLIQKDISNFEEL
jgi:predicted transcriptional regulator of viral defense system